MEVRLGCGREHVSGPAVDFVLADQAEIEGLRHFIDEGMALAALLLAGGALGGCFQTPLFEGVVVLALLRGGCRAAVVRNRPLGRPAIDDQMIHHIHGIRLYAPARVEALLFGALGVEVALARLPAPVRILHRAPHDLLGVELCQDRAAGREEDSKDTNPHLYVRRTAGICGYEKSLAKRVPGRTMV